MKGCILIAITLCLFNCGEDGPDPVSVWTPDSTVHLAGNGALGSYWKNGVFSPLSEGSQVQSMSVDDTLVLIGGWFSKDGDTRSMIWRNGKETDILGANHGGTTLVAARDNKVFAVCGALLYKNGTTTMMNPAGWPTGMALLGDDVYVAGSSQGSEYEWMVSPFYPLDTYAICWKNEQEVFRETENSYANTISIYKADIYLGGHLNHYPSLDRIACYWKNGQRVTLTDEDQNAEVTSLFITDTHVYAAGVINDQAVYWKDGIVTSLSNGVTSSIAYSISVLGTDVYVAGRENKFVDGRDYKYPAVWKNGVKQDIPNQDKMGVFNAIVAVPN